MCPSHPRACPSCLEGRLYLDMEGDGLGDQQNRVPTSLRHGHSAACGDRQAEYAPLGCWRGCSSPEYRLQTSLSLLGPQAGPLTSVGQCHIPRSGSFPPLPPTPGPQREGEPVSTVLRLLIRVAQLTGAQPFFFPSSHLLCFPAMFHTTGGLGYQLLCGVWKPKTHGCSECVHVCVRVCTYMYVTEVSCRMSFGSSGLVDRWFCDT